MSLSSWDGTSTSSTDDSTPWGSEEEKESGIQENELCSLTEDLIIESREDFSSSADSSSSAKDTDLTHRIELSYKKFSKRRELRDRRDFPSQTNLWNNLESKKVVELNQERRHSPSCGCPLGFDKNNEKRLAWERRRERRQRRMSKKQI